MTAVCKSAIHSMILLWMSMKIVSLPQDETQFTYYGFHQSNLHLDGKAEILPSGILRLTDTSKQQTGHAFYQLPVNFSSASSSPNQPFSFSTYFVFAVVPGLPIGGHGMAFAISPSTDFRHAVATQYLGLLNLTNDGLSSNHILAVEFDYVKSPEFEDIDNNHVGIDLNNLKSNVSASAAYFSDTEGVNKSLMLTSGDPIQVWIEYDGVEKFLAVSLAPVRSSKPSRPLLSMSIDLSLILSHTAYVGFSAATGEITSSHYLLGWSFNRSGEAQSLEISKLPSVPRLKQSRKKPNLEVIAFIVAATIVLMTISGALYILRRRKYEEVHEDWEREYGPQRFCYKDLYKGTKGFKDKMLLGAGGFGQVYRGVLPSKAQVAVKKISHNSAQGMKEFVAEIASMGRLRHRNLVQLLGYCRRKGELLLVYDYMPNGSLDNFLFTNEKPNLNWPQRYHIIKGIASSLLYLHEEWEQVVLHRDVKASNVLLDANLNGRLGDFGLAKLCDHGTNPQTTHVVGTVGYLAPELTKTGKADTRTDIFAFGAFLLEVACGRRPIEPDGSPEERALVDWVFQSWKQGAILQTADPRLEDSYVPEQMELVLKLGLLCSQSDPEARPSTRLLMQYLDGNAMLPEMLPDCITAGTISVGNEVPNHSVMSYISSFERTCPHSTSSSESILRIGR